MSQAEMIKTLKVKTSALKRTHKEASMYEKERDREQAKVDKLKADNADAHDVKQAENVLNESAMMIPESKKRLEAVYNDLRSFVAENGKDIPEDSEDMAAAKEVLAAVEETFKA
uniref:Tubulin-specific chaperone A n=1 Tax=Dunaliella tertiolecta TaxID=3047 RepID=A0A7S3R266_DUNTE